MCTVKKQTVYLYTGNVDAALTYNFQFLLVKRDAAISRSFDHTSFVDDKFPPLKLVILS